MTFNSLEFFLFFPIVATLYFLLPHKYRHVHLLIASCVFYMAVFPEHVFVILFIVMMNYMGGLLIEGVPSPWKKGVLTVGIILNLSTLFLFKYVNFFSDTVYHLLRIFHIAASGKPIMNLLLPLGLSFMTLRSISYLVEVYRNRMPAEKNPAFFSATMLFFPTLINGPIEKPNLFNAQFKEVHTFNSEDLYAGLRLILWGIFKKVVIADRLATYVNAVYADPGHYGWKNLVLAAVFFSFQVYADFSGYSDIARGTAKIMGFRLSLNFDTPFSSRSMADFWRRWHISLSSALGEMVCSHFIVYHVCSKWFMAWGQMDIHCVRNDSWPGIDR
jgi:alginate O-acetyltransferase complex protein AlgI